MYFPKKDERVLVCPTNPNEPVQRGVNTFGQFLQNGWQEVLFNDFLHSRMMDGSLLVKSLPSFPPLPSLPPLSPSFNESTNESIVEDI